MHKALEILKKIKNDKNYCDNCNGLDYCNNFNCSVSGEQLASELIVTYNMSAIEIGIHSLFPWRFFYSIESFKAPSPSDPS